jgi:hypothetical protein
MTTNFFKTKVLGAFFVLSLFTLGCGKSSPDACDCAHLLENGPMNRDYTAEQLNDGDFLRKEADEYVDKAKECALKYGNLTDMEKEITKGTLEMNMIPKLYQSIENATKECASTKEFDQKDLEIACDCWDQSVEKSGMAYDDMSTSQQQFREKCFKVFGDEPSMKKACEAAIK